MGATGEGPVDGASWRGDAACAGQNSVTALAAVLSQLVSIAECEKSEEDVTLFHIQQKPVWNVHDYALRIAKYFECSDECFVLCLVYIDRLAKMRPEFAMSSRSVHKLMLTSMVVAVKFHDDSHYTNRYYAKVGGLRVEELNALEADLLRLLAWRLDVSPREFDSAVAVAALAQRCTSAPPRARRQQPIMKRKTRPQPMSSLRPFFEKWACLPAGRESEASTVSTEASSDSEATSEESTDTEAWLARPTSLERKQCCDCSPR